MNPKKGTSLHLASTRPPFRSASSPRPRPRLPSLARSLPTRSVASVAAMATPYNLAPAPASLAPRDTDASWASIAPSSRAAGSLFPNSLLLPRGAVLVGRAPLPHVRAKCATLARSTGGREGTRAAPASAAARLAFTLPRIYTEREREREGRGGWKWRPLSCSGPSGFKKVSVMSSSARADARGGCRSLSSPRIISSTWLWLQRRVFLWRGGGTCGPRPLARPSSPSLSRFPNHKFNNAM